MFRSILVLGALALPLLFLGQKAEAQSYTGTGGATGVAYPVTDGSGNTVALMVFQIPANPDGTLNWTLTSTTGGEFTGSPSWQNSGLCTFFDDSCFELYARPLLILPEGIPSVMTSSESVLPNIFELLWGPVTIDPPSTPVEPEPVDPLVGWTRIGGGCIDVLQGGIMSHPTLGPIMLGAPILVNF